MTVQLENDRVWSTQSLLFKKNMVAQLRFSKPHLNKPQDVWRYVPGQPRAK